LYNEAAVGARAARWGNRAVAEIHHYGGSRPAMQPLPPLIFSILRVGETHALEKHVSNISNEQRQVKI
jgi:hypothetical protein